MVRPGESCLCLTADAETVNLCFPRVFVLYKVQLLYQQPRGYLNMLKCNTLPEKNCSRWSYSDYVKQSRGYGRIYFPHECAHV
jgi:hypothetical protein